MSRTLFLVDNSFSVLNYHRSYTAMVKNIIQILKTHSPQTLLSVALFNDQLEVLFQDKQASTVDTNFCDSLRIAGSTALYDSLNVVLTKVPESDQGGLIIILTDGEDTRSKLQPHFLARKVDSFKQKGYKFIFLGTTPQSMFIGKNIGCNVCILYDTTEKSFQSVVKVLEPIISNKVQHDGDVDVREITDILSSFGI